MNSRTLLDEALEASGGRERWRSTAELVCRFSAGGFAFASRLKAGGLRDVEGRVSTAEQKVILSPYPRQGRRGIFEGDSVRIESEDGGPVAARAGPRNFFLGRNARALRRKIRWDDMDLLYFAGYALWNYMSTPFLFTQPGFETQEIDPWAEDGELWRRLRVRFPVDIATHCREQTFYFDERLTLRRLDYTAEPFGPWAKAAHYCYEHRDFSGLVFSTRRSVYLRLRSGRPAPRPVLVWIELRDVESVGV